MKRLWLYYPENDVALASGSKSFTAPSAAVALRTAGEILPLWMASSGDRVLCNGIDRIWLAQVRSRYGIEADIWDHCDFNLSPTPWGWSYSSRRFFESAGFSPEALPDDKQLHTYRMLSHRRTSSAIASRLGSFLDFVGPAATEIDCVDRLATVLDIMPRCVIKSPWSSSGRGVHFVDSANREHILRQAAGTIRRQGSVMVEPFVERRLDFAMLFDYKFNRANYCGLSLFETDCRSGKYMCNIVAGQQLLAAKVGSRICDSNMLRLRNALAECLENELGDSYEGPVGIDLMATPDGRVFVAEMNMRYTMGFVSLALARYIPDGSTYIFEIVPGHHTPCDSIFLVPPGNINYIMRRHL